MNFLTPSNQPMLHTKRLIIIGIFLLTVIDIPIFANLNNRSAVNNKNNAQTLIIQPAQLMHEGKLISEETDGFGLLSFLYANNIGQKSLPFFKLQVVSKLYGAYQDSFVSKYKIAAFVKKHHINLDDFEQPKNGYQSFNDFFIRKIKPGRRPIEKTPKTLIAPADSKLFVIPVITQDITFFVKKLPFNLETFLQNSQLAADYSNGTMLIFRLAPYDYHRFHFPAAGIPEAPIVIDGQLDSVNPLVYKSGVQPLMTNVRHVIKFITNEFDTVLMIPVGAMMVGKIIETYNPSQKIGKGDEAGYFSFGGSTVVLLFKPGVIKLKQDLIENSEQGFETVVKMGQAITS